MTDPTPTEIAFDAYDRVLNQHLTHHDRSVGKRGRQLLQGNPAIKAMLAAHERAVLLAAGQKIRDRAEQHAANYPGQLPAQLTYRRHMLTAARLIEPEPTDDEIRTGLVDLLGGMAARRETTQPATERPTR